MHPLYPLYPLVQSLPLHLSIQTNHSHPLFQSHPFDQYIQYIHCNPFCQSTQLHRSSQSTQVYPFFLFDQIFQPVGGVAPVSFKTGMQNLQPVQDSADCLVQFLLDPIRLKSGASPVLAILAASAVVMAIYFLSRWLGRERTLQPA